MNMNWLKRLFHLHLWEEKGRTYVYVKSEYREYPSTAILLRCKECGKMVSEKVYGNFT